MRTSRQRLFGIACLAIWTALSTGCVDSDTEPSGSGGTGATTSTGPGGSGGEGGQGGEAGTGGETGQGGSGAGAKVPHAPEWISGGGVASSKALKMVFTLGQPIESTRESMSSKYRIESGPAFEYGSDQ